MTQRRKRLPKTITQADLDAMSEIEREKVKKALEQRQQRMYFNANTCIAIEAYQKSTSKTEREKYFKTEILPAFDKLVENLIIINKFVAMQDSQEALKNDCINFLFETLHKFDTARGTNAFSYFNVVAKNWLIIKTKQRLLNLRKNVSLDNKESLMSNDKNLIDERNYVQSAEDMNLNFIDIEKIIHTLFQIKAEIYTPNEESAINAIITLFDNINDIDLLNKSAVLLYMRELSGLTQKQLTVAMQHIKKVYKRIKAEDAAFDVLSLL